MRDANVAILEQLTIHLSTLRGPWIIAGDWNLSPDVLQASGWLDTVGGSIVAPSDPTCFDNVYDFFVISNNLRHAVAGVTRIDDIGTVPHYGARLFLKGNTRHKAVRRLSKPRKVQSLLPCGPAPAAVFARTPATFDTEQDLYEGLAEWFNVARGTWNSLLGRDNRDEGTKFRWESAAGATAFQ